MSYQVRHKEFGIFQGECLGMFFWWPMSEMPEQGICKFDTPEEAQKFIDYHVGEGDIYHKKNFSIEPFDEKLDFEISNIAVMEDS